MTKEELQRLDRGDIIRHRTSGDAMVVTTNYGSHAVAVRTEHVSNPDEWLLISKHRSNG